jgi:hypothetical protein
MTAVCFGEAPELPEWSGHGAYRVLIDLPADQVDVNRETDEQVASCDLEFSSWLAAKEIEGAVELNSLQLHRYDSQSGKPLDGVPFASAASPYDWPCRYEDAFLPERYPSRVGRASETADGRPPQIDRLRKGRLFNREMDSSIGKLIWSHVQIGNEEAHYALYFNVRSQENPWGVSPAPWIGDGDVLRQRSGSSLGGFSHFTAAVGDLNGDGLDDLVAGTEKGDLMWFPNRGTRDLAKFHGCHILQDVEGPIDTGWYAAPFLYDWDDDGLLDLLVGTSGNVILWWQNGGSKQQPRFEYRGFVMCGDHRLEVPEAPVAEDQVGIFKRDYFNQPWIGDFNGDSLPDIVTGGYTTGRIFWFEGNRRSPNGVPQLQPAKTLDTEEGPIDTVWAASPFVMDVNGDGQSDLLTGGWWWSGIPTPPGPGEADLLMYYRHLGGSNHQLRKQSFPRQGNFPPGQIARPSLMNYNGDDLPDLLISHSGGDVYAAPNIGRTREPNWKMPSKKLTIPWGFTRDWNASTIGADVDGDGIDELLVGNVVWTVGGDIRSPKNSLLGVCRVDGEPIEHPGPGYGDPYYFSLFYDWNEDGRMDVLWGTQQGNLYVHLQSGSQDPLDFGPGELVELTSGEPLHVGPPVVASPDEATDFTILQGSRIVFAMDDFDQDAIEDLIVGDTFAQLWLFQGVAENSTRRFLPGLLLGKLPTRPEAICIVDWNHDDKPDLLIGGTAAQPVMIYANTSRPGKPALATGESIEGLPYLFWGPRLRATDWNNDGDVDLMVQSEFFSFWIEGSFLEHGYRQAKATQSTIDQQFIQPKHIARNP